MPICSSSNHNDVIRKIWQGNISDLQPAQLKRIQLLDRYGEDFNPGVTVSIEATQVVIQQKWIDCVDVIDSVKSQKIVERLALQIDKLHEIGVVHGDLCYSNVGLKHGEIYIFDWEPVLIINSGPREVDFRTTKFAFHPRELKKGEIGFASDRFAFICLYLQIRKERYFALELIQEHVLEIAELADSYTQCLTLSELLPDLDWV